MHARSVRHVAGVLAVTIASGLLFSVSALNERKNPAATSDLSTLVRNRQEQVKTLENEVSELDTQIQSYTSVAPQSGDEDVFTARLPPKPSPAPASKSLSATRPPEKFPKAQPPTTSSSTSKTSKTR